MTEDRHNDGIVRSVVFLRQHLTPAAWEQLRTVGYISVKGESSGANYEIGYQYVSSGRTYFCARAATFVGDDILAKKLWLETDEQQFRQSANASEYHSIAHLRDAIRSRNEMLLSWLASNFPLPTPA